MDANRQRYAADISSIKEAHERIKPYIHRTLVLTSESLNSISGRSLFFKCECFQKGGAFKFRGACNAVLSLGAEQAAKGIVTHISGNHVSALSLAAKIQGIPAYIVIPKGAPKCKVDNVIRCGGTVTWSEATMSSREEVASKVLQDKGSVLIHPYNDGRIIRLKSNDCKENIAANTANEVVSDNSYSDQGMENMTSFGLFVASTKELKQ